MKTYISVCQDKNEYKACAIIISISQPIQKLVTYLFSAPIVTNSENKTIEMLNVRKFVLTTKVRDVKLKF